MERFTKREKDVLLLLIEGFNNHEISDILCISNHTTKAHVAAIYRKLNVVNRVQATIACYFLCELNPEENKDFLKVYEKLKRF